MLRLTLPLLALIVAACVERAAPPTPVAVRTSDAVPYSLNAPDAVFELPGELTEASGLAVLPSGRLATVQDEDGLVYELDPATGRVVNRTRFDGAGDYEGIEWGGDALWVLKSNGDLYRLVAGEPVENIETPLASRNDTEGLAWDARGQRLLIAAKAHPGRKLGHVRAIYAVDPATRQMAPAPAFVLDRRVVDTPDAEFRPSALAIHPATGLLYVLSSVRKAIAVLDRDGDLVEVVDLPPRLFRQPEGLAFLPDGTLFIESEGSGGRAVLVRYSTIPTTTN